MERISAPEAFLAHPGRPPVTFKQWRFAFDTYLLAIGGKDFSADRQKAVLLSCLGQGFPTSGNSPIGENQRIARGNGGLPRLGHSFHPIVTCIAFPRIPKSKSRSKSRVFTGFTVIADAIHKNMLKTEFCACETHVGYGSVVMVVGREE